MILKIDRLPVELPAPKKPDPNAARVVQELLGGRFGEMSTLMNYTYQSFNFRGKEKLKPYYDLLSNISAEEYGHIEMVSAAVNRLIREPGDGKEPDPTDTPMGHGLTEGNPHHFVASAQTSLPMNSLGQPWKGDYVFSSGNLILDMLHNFFLENGARTQKLRVYQMTDNPAARMMLGYLFVRGGVHAMAYAKALESLTGVNMTKMLPIPHIDNSVFPEAKKFEDEGSHRKLYRFSPDDYRDIGQIWNGPVPDGSGEFEVVDGPPEGAPRPDWGTAEESFSPEYHPGEIFEMAQHLYKKAAD